jgi:hypothetical protein
MIRNLKALGLTAVAVFAMSAMVASAAQAAPAELKSDGSSVTLKAAWGNDAFDAFNSNVTCANGSLDSVVAVPSSTFTVTPTYTNCKVGGVLPATVNFTSCDYLFHLGETTKEHEAPATTDVKCTKAGDTIDITVFASEAAHKENKPICHITVAEQLGLAGGKVNVDTGATSTADDITISGTVAGIAAKQVRNSALCPVGTEESAGKYTINANKITVTGTNPANGAETGLRLS